MIKFGTSGWRGIIGEDFTFRNVRLVTRAVVELIKRYGRSENGILVSYDTRFLSERFARETARILATNSIKTYITDRDAPTPAISYAIIKRHLEGGINITASNNPAEYNGFKYFTSTGCSAMPELTNQLEEEIKKIDVSEIKVPPRPAAALLKNITIQDDYLDFVKSKIALESLKNSGLKIGLDLLYGTARDYLDKLLIMTGCETHILHNFRDPYFGGYSPSANEENLSELRSLILEKKLDAGLATSADSDRFGIMDEKGEFIHPNIMVALLYRYLIEQKGIKGSAARSVATSHIIDHVARKAGTDIIETPVGFKYISSLFLSDKIIFGGEESGGISIAGHIPVKDGILASLLAAEMIVESGVSLSQLIRDLFDQIGFKIYFKSESFDINQDKRKEIENLIDEEPGSIGGRKIVNINKTDGIKLYTENDSWLLIRFSGTEPVLRMYAEAFDQKELAGLLKAAVDYYLR